MSASLLSFDGKQESQETPEFLRHPIEGPQPDRYRRFHPYGFPVDVHTNSSTVLEILEELWGGFHERFVENPIHCEIIVTETRGTRCPPEPRFHLRPPLVTTTCDRDNFSIVDLERGSVYTQLTKAALRHRLFAGYFLLPTATACICTRYVTAIHAACVSWKSHGILLCGEAGAGKSTLAYSCARHGWTYTTDDASFLLYHPSGRRVIGNCYQARMRPQAAALFPEISGLQTMPRAAGKPSIQLLTSTIENLSTSFSADVHSIVFLNRAHAAGPELVPFPRAEAKQSMIRLLYGMPDMLAKQYRAIDRLLSVPVFELRYRTLEEARRLLQKLAEEGFHHGDHAAADF
jgi:hypothetical protein